MNRWDVIAIVLAVAVPFGFWADQIIKRLNTIISLLKQRDR